MKTIIGLAGLMASGKGTVAAYLASRHGATTFRFSDPFREALETFDLEVSRENMQRLSTLMRQHFGENVLARAVAKKARLAPDGLVVVDGVRRLTDIESLVELPEFHLVAIAADQRLRYERCVRRDENASDAAMSFEQFCERGQAEAEVQIPAVMAQAQLTIHNDGTVEELYGRVEDAIRSLGVSS